jgi:hypothetical protein
VRFWKTHYVCWPRRFRVGYKQTTRDYFDNFVSSENRTCELLEIRYVISSSITALSCELEQQQQLVFRRFFKVLKGKKTPTRPHITHLLLLCVFSHYLF